MLLLYYTNIYWALVYIKELQLLYLINQPFLIFVLLRLYNSSSTVLTTVLSTLWSIIVVITLGKCAHRTPAGVREHHTCIISLMKIKNFIWKHHFHSWTSVALNRCVSWIPRSRILILLETIFTGKFQIFTMFGALENLI
jgi:hypothetical protein